VRSSRTRSRSDAVQIDIDAPDAVGPLVIPRKREEGWEMIILLVLLFVLLFFGLGFAAPLLWIVAAIVFFVWIIGLALGRSSSGRHHFYRW
jgi:hypothetical protein